MKINKIAGSLFYRNTFFLIAGTVLSACSNDPVHPDHRSDSIADSFKSILLKQDTTRNNPVLPLTIKKPWQGTDHTVLGYYLNIPGAFLVNNEGYLLLDSTFDTPLARTQLIHNKNINDGYIRLESRAEIKVWEGWVDVGLFHNSETNDTLCAIFYYSCGPGCVTGYGFMKYSNGAWSDHGSDVFPMISEEELKEMYAKVTKKKLEDCDTPSILYDLHPNRNSIDVIVDPQFEDGKIIVLGTLLFKNGKFNLTGK